MLRAEIERLRPLCNLHESATDENRALRVEYVDAFKNYGKAVVGARSAWDAAGAVIANFIRGEVMPETRFPSSIQVSEEAS